MFLSHINSTLSPFLSKKKAMKKCPQVREKKIKVLRGRSWKQSDKKNSMSLPVKMEVQVNMTHLLAQSQQKLKLNYKTTITQNHQKMELYISLTTKELKKSHSFGQVGGAEMRNRRSHTHVWWVKIRREISQARDPNPRPHHPAQGASARKLPELLAIKISAVWGGRRNCGILSVYS